MGNPSRREVLSLLSTFVPESDAERFTIEMTRAFVEVHTNVLHRSNLQGHLVASAFIVDPARTRFLLIHHKKLGKWIQPGGHADGEADLFAVAAREAREETGLRSLEGRRRVFDVDVHTIPPRALVPAHLHYDVRFLFAADPREKLRPKGDECLAAAWRDRGDVSGLEGSVVRMVEKAFGAGSRALRPPAATLESDKYLEHQEMNMNEPQLTDLPTVAEHTARVLAEHGLRSVADVAAASIETLSAVPGFGDARAATVRQAAAELLGEAPIKEESVKKDSSEKTDGKKKKVEKKKKDKKKGKKKKDKKKGKKKDKKKDGKKKKDKKKGKKK